MENSAALGIRTRDVETSALARRCPCIRRQDKAHWAPSEISPQALLREKAPRRGKWVLRINLDVPFAGHGEIPWGAQSLYAGRDCGATAPCAVPSRSVPRTIRRSAISTTCIRNFLEIEPNHMQTATVVQGEINGSELWSAATPQRELSRFPLAATNLGILHGRHDRRGRSFAPLVISSPLAWSAAARGRRRDR